MPKTFKVVAKMRRIYGTDYDFLGNPVKNQKVDYHHINERRNGSETSVANGALLSPKAHSQLHLIEMLDLELYNEIKTMFSYINKRALPIDKELAQTMQGYYKKMKKLIAMNDEIKKEREIASALGSYKSSFSYQNQDDVGIEGDIEFHFIEPLILGGKANKDNIVIINTEIHKKLHQLYFVNRELYNQINELYSQMKSSPQKDNKILKLQIRKLFLLMEKELNTPIDIDSFIDQKLSKSKKELLKSLISKYNLKNRDCLQNKINHQNRITIFSFYSSLKDTTVHIPLTRESIGKIRKLQQENERLYNEIIYWLEIIDQINEPIPESILPSIKSVMKRANTYLNNSKKTEAEFSTKL